MDERDDKITVGSLRSVGVQFCADHKCSHSASEEMASWDYDVILTALGKKFVCKVCGHRGALTQPNYHELPPPSPKQ